MLPAEIHNKIYDIVDTMNSFDVAEHNRKTEKLMIQFFLFAHSTRSLEDEDDVKPSLIVAFRPLDSEGRQSHLSIYLKIRDIFSKEALNW